MPRPLAKVINRGNGRSVVLQVLRIDDNFRRKYADSPHTLKLPNDVPVAVMNEWYRDCLGLQRGETAELEIRPTCRIIRWFAQIRASYSHPDHNVRLAANLATVSVALGFLGLILGVVSLFR